jgi:hypothetical protein
MLLPFPETRKQAGHPRVDGGAEVLERFEFRAVIDPGGLDPIQRGLRAVIGAVNFGTGMGFGLELKGGLKEVLEPEAVLGIAFPTNQLLVLHWEENIILGFA